RRSLPELPISPVIPVKVTALLRSENALTIPSALDSLSNESPNPIVDVDGTVFVRLRARLVDLAVVKGERLVHHDLAGVRVEVLAPKRGHLAEPKARRGHDEDDIPRRCVRRERRQPPHLPCGEVDVRLLLPRLRTRSPSARESLGRVLTQPPLIHAPVQKADQLVISDAPLPGRWFPAVLRRHRQAPLLDRLPVKLAEVHAT